MARMALFVPVHQMHIYEQIPAAAGMHETVTFMDLH